MGYGDFSGWICGCGAKVDEWNGPLPEGWRIVWPECKDEKGYKLVDAVPPPGIYCQSCWNALPDALPDAPCTARVDTDGATYRKALMDYGKQSRLAYNIQQRTSERFALGKRYEDIMGEDHEGIRELIGGGLHHRCFPAEPPPDIAGIAMIIHPSAMASGLQETFYRYLEQLAARYNQEVHLFWDETRWYLIFIGGSVDEKTGNFNGYNTGKCEFWLAFYPDGTSKILGVS